MCASYSALKINKYLHELLKRLTDILVIYTLQWGHQCIKNYPKPLISAFQQHTRLTKKFHFFSDLRALCILHKYVMPLWSYDRWLHEQKTTPKDMTYKCCTDHHLFRIRHRSHYIKKGLPFFESVWILMISRITESLLGQKPPTS